MAGQKVVKPGLSYRDYPATVSYGTSQRSSTPFPRSVSPTPRPPIGIRAQPPPPPQGGVKSHVSPPSRARSPDASAKRVSRKSTTSPLRNPAPSRPLSPQSGKSANQRPSTRPSSPSPNRASSPRPRSPSPTQIASLSPRSHSPTQFTNPLTRSPSPTESSSPLSAYLDFVISPQPVPPALAAPFVHRARSHSSHPLGSGYSTPYIAAEINAHEQSPIATTSITETLPSASIPVPVLDPAPVTSSNSSTNKQSSRGGFRDGVLPPNVPKDVCLRCCATSKREGYQFCSDKCTDIVAAEPLPQLLRVPIGHSMEQHLKKRLAERWYKPGRVPQIESIHMITWPNVMRTSFEHYRDSVVAQRKNPISDPAEFKFFTSETRKCTLGEDGNRETCKSPACHLCQAIVTGFKSTLVRNRQRAKDGFSLDVPFGGGIYMTPCASRAAWLAKQQNKNGTGTVALLVTRTVPGRKHHVKRPDHRMTNAGKGFDSVHSGDVDTDREELVVYNEDAVRPAYLMILKQ